MRRVARSRFDFTVSRGTRVFIVVTHAATLVLIVSLPVDLPLAGSIALLVIALGARAWRGTDGELAGIVVRSDGSVVALGRDGRATDGALAEGGAALPWLASIAWRREGERRIRIEDVAADRLGPNAHRELRVLLRYATSGDEAEAPASQARASISTALSLFGWPARR